MQHTQHQALPEADAASLAHGQKVSAYLRAQIEQAGGSISFADYMQQALYAPGLGYYVAGRRKFGADGDFVTAPEISPLFGRVIARQCVHVLQELGGGDVLEFGAGSGKLAVDVLTALEELDCLPERYRILEVSAELQQRQQQRLHEQRPQFAERVEWLAALPEAHRGVIVANEVLDAMPVERFVRTEAGVAQQRVRIDGEGFAFTELPATEGLTQAVQAVESDLGECLSTGFTSELPLAGPAWVADIGRSLRAGCILLFDYGCSRREYYAADRSEGWLRCHFRHYAHNNPLLHIGIQDITAWVDFSAIAEAGVSAGLSVSGYVPQAMFLAGGGLQQEMSVMSSLSQAQQLELSAQLKTLTLPGEMGENIKCIGFHKGLQSTLPAFQFGDRTHTL